MLLRMEEFEDVEETLERLQREWLAGDNAFPLEDQFTPSYCYGCARTSGVAVCRKPLPKKQKKSKPAAKGISRKGVNNHVKSKSVPNFKKVLTIQASAKIKKKALSNLLGQKNERGNAKSSLVNKKSKGVYTCDECGQVFTFSCNLRRHLEQHVQKAKEYRCRQCGEAFTVKRAYVRHVQKHKTDLINVTSDDVEESDAINTPDYYPGEDNDLSDNDNVSDDVDVSDNVDAWTYDMENTHSPELSNAHFSDNSLNASTSAAANAFTSEEERPYACYKCGKTFSRNMYLNQHMRVHNTARPFSCQFCTRKFKTRHHSKNHEKSHMFSKPYPCKYCPMSFSRNAYRAIHERRKHPQVHMESSR